MNQIFSDGSDCRISGLVPGRSALNLAFIQEVANRQVSFQLHPISSPNHQIGNVARSHPAGDSCLAMAQGTLERRNEKAELWRTLSGFFYRSADKSLARPTSRCILFDCQNISFDASLVIYINSTNIPPIMIINRIYETKNLLSLQLVSFLVGLRTYQHPCVSTLFCYLQVPSTIIL